MSNFEGKNFNVFKEDFFKNILPKLADTKYVGEKATPDTILRMCMDMIEHYHKWSQGNDDDSK